MSLGGEFLECCNDLVLFGSVIERAGGVEQRDADVHGVWFGDGALGGCFIGVGSTGGVPGDDAWFFHVVGVSRERGVDVFSNHEGCFKRIVLIMVFKDLINSFVVIVFFRERYVCTMPVSFLFDDGDAGVYGIDDASIVCILGGEKDHHIDIRLR